MPQARETVITRVRRNLAEFVRFGLFPADQVEAALARAQAELGIIPEAAAREIIRKAHLPYLDLAAVQEGLARTGHPLVPLVWALDRACGGSAADSGRHLRPSAFFGVARDHGHRSRAATLARCGGCRFE